MKLADAVFIYSFKRYSFYWKLTSLIIFTASLTRPSLRAHIASLRLIYTSRLMSFPAVGGRKREPFYIPKPCEATDPIWRAFQ